MRDNHLVLADGQAITADAATTNYVDLGADFDWGAGEPLFAHFRVDENFNTLTSLTFILQTDTDAAFGSPKELLRSPAVPLASLVVGYHLELPIPPGVEGKLRGYLDVTGTNPTTGKISAWVGPAPQTNV